MAKKEIKKEGCTFWSEAWGVDDGKYFPLLGISYRTSMEALLMKYEGFVSISYGMLCAQFEWIYYRRAQVENIFRNKYLKLSEHYKNQKPLWLKNVPKGTYKLLLYREISKIF